MDISADFDAACDAVTLHTWVDDLDTYPQWLSIVGRSVGVDAVATDAGPAWLVDLRAKVGPLSRSKRLRMVRTELDERHVRFERRELDGQEHAAWVLRAEFEPHGERTTLTMHLHYGGRLWEPLVERLLRDEIAQSRARLAALISG